jgi:hypothetical protein
MTTWQPTYGGKRAFLKAVKAGIPYYTVAECVQPWGNEPKYSVWIFEDKGWLGLRCGHLTPTGVLSGFGPISDEKPVGILPINERGTEYEKQLHVPVLEIRAREKANRR